MSNQQSLQFMTRFEPHDGRDIYTVYDFATELTFSLGQAYKGTGSLSVHLEEKTLFLYQDDVKIDGKTFSIFTDMNFLDAMKDFADLDDSEVLLIAELTLDGEVYEVMESLDNPWF